MTTPRQFPQTTKPAADEVRQMLVHPAVWRSLEAWLHSMQIGLVPLPPAVGTAPTYGMTPIDGEWGEA